MRLYKARVKNYRSIIDSGEFEVEKLKTIFVGPNEAGKTVILRALQQLNKPDDVSGFDALRDYPRSKYNDISSGKVNIKDVEAVEGIFTLEDDDKALIDERFHNCEYKLTRRLNNKGYYQLVNSPERTFFKDLNKDFTLIEVIFHTFRLLFHCLRRYR